MASGNRYSFYFCGRMKRRILLLGSGGREHALAWKMKQSDRCEALFIGPGNAGTSDCGTNVPVSPNDFEAAGKFCIENQINLLVVGPEDPLVAGIADYFHSHAELKHIPVVGPVKAGAILEGSKAYSKEFMMKYGIPTAAYRSFIPSQEKEAFAFLETLRPPYVLKADGLAAGKGVVILEDLEETKKELSSFFEGKFGDASKTVVIEEFLKGIEVSVFVLTDGKSYVRLPEAKDYKRIGEGDTGLNTGGMGAVSPVPFAQGSFMEKVEERIIKPTIAGLQKENIPYKGFVFIGLMKVNDDPFVIEYNCRMGDPETEVVIPRIENDLVEIFEAVVEERLSEISLRINPQTATTVMLVSGGYPEAYEKGKVMQGMTSENGAILFHAGTAQKGNETVTNGGRVCAATAFGNSIAEAVGKSLQLAEKIDFEKKYYRRDIGKDLMQDTKN